MSKWIKAETEKPKIEEIWIEHIVDDNPDLSFLESEVVDGKVISDAYSQADYDEDPKTIEKYIEEDTKRLNDYGNTWVQWGIRAVAEVSYPIASQPGSRRLERFTSSGIWGIDSDSDGAGIAAEEESQLDDLKSHLEQFGVDVSDFDSKCSGEVKEVAER